MKNNISAIIWNLIIQLQEEEEVNEIMKQLKIELKKEGLFF
jgi:hypothetical protein